MVMTIFYLTQIALGVAVYWSFYWLAVPLVLVSSHLMHGILIALHEASHGLLRKNRTLNEIDGILIAAFGGMSFSLYRVVHQSHHAHLATERDEELWPFVHPGVSRPARILAAILELGLGMLYTPFLFIRGICPAGIDDSKKEPAPAHLGGVRRGAMPVDCHFGSCRLVRSLEILHLGLLGASLAGRKHAKFAQIHRACRHAGLHGEQLNTEHRRPWMAGQTGGVYFAARTFSWCPSPAFRTLLTPNFLSSLRFLSRRGRMNDRPLRVIGKHFSISSGAWQIHALARSGTSPNPSAGSIWRRLADEKPPRYQHLDRVRP